MGEVKTFRVTGKITKPNFQTSFRKEVRAIKPDHAVEQLYKELGSKHRVKRFHIRIIKVEEVKPEEIESPIIKKLAQGGKDIVKQE